MKDAVAARQTAEQKSLFNQKSSAGQDLLLKQTLARETLLLRSCQLGIVMSGILLILIGSGVHAAWLQGLALVGVSGAISGLIYENRRRLRGEGDGAIAVLLPLAGVLSGAFALLAPV